MHHTKIRVPGVLSAWIIHNSDWSGDVELCWEHKGGNIHRVRVPGSVLLGFATQHVSDEIEEALSALQKLDHNSRNKVG